MTTTVTKIHPTPVVSISPRVLSAMDSFTSFVPHSEKGMLFLGRVDGMNVTLEDFILYPQRGNDYGIDFDDKHKHAAKFWPSVQAYIKESGLTLVGWGHYWHGGVHHSHDDMWQDDKFSTNLKDSSPVFVSLTWNDKQIGAEAKLWGKVGGKDVQVSVPNIDVQILIPERVVDKFIMDNPPRGTVRVRFGHVEIPVQDSDDVCDSAIAWLYQNPNALGSLLTQEEIRNYVVDDEVVKETHEKLKNVFSPRYGGIGAEFSGKSLLDKVRERTRSVSRDNTLPKDPRFEDVSPPPRKGNEDVRVEPHADQR